LEVSVGEHSEKRKSHEAKIVKLRADRDGIDSRIAGEKEKAADLGRKAAKLAPDAVSGDEKALSEQNRLLAEESKAKLQAQNLETIAAPIRTQLAEAEAARANLVLAEQIEKIAAEIPKLAEMAKTLSAALTPIARDFGQLKKEISSAAAIALPLVGDSVKVSRLSASLLQHFDAGVRAGFFQIFHAQGLELFDAVKYSGEDFETVMSRPLGELRRALESRLHTTSGIPVSGRALFIARTNIGGLHGLHIGAGEKISLKIDDPEVVRLDRITGRKRWRSGVLGEVHYFVFKSPHKDWFSHAVAQKSAHQQALSTARKYSQPLESRNTPNKTKGQNDKSPHKQRSSTTQKFYHAGRISATSTSVVHQKASLGVSSDIENEYENRDESSSVSGNAPVEKNDDDSPISPDAPDRIELLLEKAKTILVSRGHERDYVEIALDLIEQRSVDWGKAPATVQYYLVAFDNVERSHEESYLVSDLVKKRRARYAKFGMLVDFAKMQLTPEQEEARQTFNRSRVLRGEEKK
jgi:hypothetical protein